MGITHFWGFYRNGKAGKGCGGHIKKREKHFCKISLVPGTGTPELFTIKSNYLWLCVL